MVLTLLAAVKAPKSSPLHACLTSIPAFQVVDYVFEIVVVFDDTFVWSCSILFANSLAFLIAVKKTSWVLLLSPFHR